MLVAARGEIGTENQIYGGVGREKNGPGLLVGYLGSVSGLGVWARYLGWVFGSSIWANYLGWIFCAS